MVDTQSLGFKIPWDAQGFKPITWPNAFELPTEFKKVKNCSNDAEIGTDTEPSTLTQILILAANPSIDPFWNDLARGAKKAANKKNSELMILYPKIPGDIREQIRLLNEAIEFKPDRIGAYIANFQQFLPVLKKSQQQNIPIVMLHARPSKEFEKDFSLSHISVDHFTAGQLAALKAYKSGQIHTRVVVAIHQPDDENISQRFEGILNILSGLGVIVDRLDFKADLLNFDFVLEQHLKKFPEITGVFCLEGLSLQAIAQKIPGYTKLPRSNPLYFCSFDQSLVALKLIQLGLMGFTVDMRPFVQGYLYVDQPKKNFKLKPSIITSENIDQEKLDRRWDKYLATQRHLNLDS